MLWTCVHLQIVFDSAFSPTASSASLCSPAITIGDLVLDSDDEDNGQREGKVSRKEQKDGEGDGQNKTEKSTGSRTWRTQEVG